MKLVKYYETYGFKIVSYEDMNNTRMRGQLTDVLNKCNDI